MIISHFLELCIHYIRFWKGGEREKEQTMEGGDERGQGEKG